jgi:hypothetical protein
MEAVRTPRIVDGSNEPAPPSTARPQLLHHLSVVERHMNDGEARIKRQFEVIAKLGRDGHDTTRAIDMLREFWKCHATQTQTVERVRSLLGPAA